MFFGSGTLVSLTFPCDDFGSHLCNFQKSTSIIVIIFCLHSCSRSSTMAHNDRRAWQWLTDETFFSTQHQRGRQAQNIQRACPRLRVHSQIQSQSHQYPIFKLSLLGYISSKLATVVNAEIFKGNKFSGLDGSSKITKLTS